MFGLEKCLYENQELGMTNSKWNLVQGCSQNPFRHKGDIGTDVGGETPFQCMWGFGPEKLV